MFILFIFPLLFITNLMPISAKSTNDLRGFAERGSIALDPTNLDLFFFRAAVSALIKAKAEAILRSITLPTERVIFRQCESDSNGRLNLLAKCLVSLFNVRDFKLNEKKPEILEERPAEMPPWKWIFSSNILKNGEENWKNKKEAGQNERKELAEEKAILMEKMESNLRKNFAIFKTLTGGEKVKSRRRKWKEELGRRKREMTTEREKKESNANAVESKMFDKFSHVQKLLKVERFYRLVEKCNEYIQRKDEEHSRFLQNANLPIRLSTSPFERNPLLEIAQSQLQGTVHFDKLSILSPKLLSILPEKAMNSSGAKDDLLSPTFLSFHEQGNFSLPYLLNLVFTNNGKETLPWLDLLLQLSGASSTLDKLLAALEPNIREIEEKIHPAIQRLQMLEERFGKLRAAMWTNRRQWTELETRGYAFLDAEQSRMMGTDGGDGNEGEFGADAGANDEEELDAILEEDIRTIAKMGTGEFGAGEGENKEGENGNGLRRRRRAKRFLSTQPYGQVRILNPYYFANQINDSAILRRVVISPKAFSGEILTADFFRFDVLSPSAFTSSILSPRAAMAHILSPVAFNARVLSPQAILGEVLSPKALEAKVLSPRAFSAFVLSPRLMIMEILSPKMLELRILNPTTIGFLVLSPTIIGTSVLSPQNHVMLVLSPSILNPGFLNEGRNNVQVLSPQILGGK